MGVASACAGRWHRVRADRGASRTKRHPEKNKVVVAGLGSIAWVWHEPEADRGGRAVGIRLHGGWDYIRACDRHDDRATPECA